MFVHWRRLEPEPRASGGAVGGGKPHGHAGGEGANFGAVGCGDTDIGPVVSGIGGGDAIGVEEPSVIG